MTAERSGNHKDFLRGMMDEFEDANLIPQNIPTNEVYMFSVGVVTFVTENICDIHPSITSY